MSSYNTFGMKQSIIVRPAPFAFGNNGSLVSAKVQKTTKCKGRLVPLNSKQTLTEVHFQPFNEVKSQLMTVENLNNEVESFARLDYHHECEAAVNEQINIEYNISYVYHSIHAFFDRDNVGLPGLAKYFLEASEEERQHAQKLITFQNIRGGRVKLSGIDSPDVDYNNLEKGDALHAMELALSLEIVYVQKLNFIKLKALQDVAVKHNDAHMSDFVESEFLVEQAKAVKEVSVYVSMLRRVGKGLGVWEFDRFLRDGKPVPDFSPV